MLNQRPNADRWIERTLRQAVEGHICTECGARPVSARPFDFERQICRPCGQAIEHACKRADRNRRESARLVGRANTPDDPRTPRYVTWKGWVIGFHSDDGHHIVWGAYPQYSGENVSKLPITRVVCIDRYVDGHTREEVLIWKRCFKTFYANSNGQLRDIRPTKPEPKAPNGKYRVADASHVHAGYRK